MKKTGFNIVVNLAIIALFALPAMAQTDPKTKPPVPAPVPSAPPEPAVIPCPKLEMRTATQPVRDGTPLKFTATIAGGDPKITPIYSWTISAGVISSGQGTTAIDVDTTGAGAEKSIYASLLIGGFPPDCAAEVNATVAIAGPAKKLDEYGILKDEEETARLNSFISNVSPTEQAFIFVYAGRTSVRGQASTEVKRIRAYFLKSGIPSDRVVTVDGGFREEPAHELWLVPIGAEYPKASPTVNSKEIVYPKPTPAVKKP